MQLDYLRNYCLAKPSVTEELPFGPDTLVFKVAGKLFALTGLEEVDLRINLKCAPDRAIDLREKYPDAILPGWHMNKRHWNSVYPDHDTLPAGLLLELIDHSYELVVAGLSRRVRSERGLA